MVKRRRKIASEEVLREVSKLSPRTKALLAKSLEKILQEELGN